jgi:hypothetical protein
LILAATASGGDSLARIGWVYRLEGYLDGQPVQYVGSATDLKQRLTSQHRWAKLLQQDNTRVYAKGVFAELDVQASNRQTLMSARNEALRAAEQRALEQVRAQVKQMNQLRAEDQQEAKVLNEINAAQDTALWETRHKVSTSGEWQLFEGRVSAVTTKALVVLTLLDVYLMHYHAKMAKYVMAPYVLEDEQGLFTLEKSESLLSSQYCKAYLNAGTRIEISAEEFRELKEEAEALWGTTDWAGDFVPGLLNRALPVAESSDGI